MFDLLSIIYLSLSYVTHLFDVPLCLFTSF